MDTTELTRAVVGVPTAAVVPAFVPGLADWRVRMPVAVVLALWAVAPLLHEWEAWALIACVVAGSTALGSSMGRLHLLPGAAVVSVVLAGGTGALLDWSASIDALDGRASAAGPLVVTAGALVTVFIGGEAIKQLLAPFTPKVTPAASADLDRAGLLIGWLERALLYGFVVAGAAGGVALVVAAKALARLPSLSKEDRFAEYFLIGTLASVLVAVGLGVAVRAILGLGPLLS